MAFYFAGIKIKIDAQAKIFTYKDLQDVPAKKGIYIMFENGQLDSHGRKRVVRIGKAIKTNNMTEKILNKTLSFMFLIKVNNIDH